MSRNTAIKFTKPICLCTDGAPSILGRTVGTVALLKRFLDCPLLKYHCIIHQEPLCGNFLYLQHAMI